MSNIYTATNLIAQIKRRGLIPTSDQTLTTADWLSFINDELQTYVVPLLMRTREEYFVAAFDTTTVAGIAAYAMPPRAIGGKLKDVQISDGSGGFRPLPHTESHRVGQSSLSGGPTAYFLQGNSVILTPTPGAAVTLRQLYFQRPNTVVTDNDCGTINSINTSTGAVTFSHGSFTSQTFDFVRGEGGFECLAIDQAGDATSSPVGFASLPSGLVVGDFLCNAGRSPVPQIPVELQPLLAQRVVARALEALSDPKAPQAVATADRMEMNLLRLLTPRVESSPKVIINRNGPGYRRSRSR